MFEAGALELLPFPFSDISTPERRPVLALTAPDAYGDFIGMAVSSRSHHEYALPLENGSLLDGELPKPSWIRIDRLVTLNAALVLKTFAKVRPGVQQQAVQNLYGLLNQYLPQA